MRLKPARSRRRTTFQKFDQDLKLYPYKLEPASNTISALSGHAKHKTQFMKFFKTDTTGTEGIQNNIQQSQTILERIWAPSSSWRHLTFFGRSCRVTHLDNH